MKTQWISITGRSLASGAVWLTGLFLAGCQSVTNRGFVAVRAQADAGYASPAQNTPPKSYVFVKGRSVSSMFDPEVKKVDFDALTKMLAANLEPRFVPASNLRQVDLVIVVQWGAVAAPERVTDDPLFNPDGVRQASEAVENAKTQAAAEFKAGNYTASMQVGIAESNLLSELQNASNVLSADAHAAASAADLIGLTGLVRPNDGSAEADALRAMLEDDRYFVSLVAFDAAALRLKIRKVVWSTRMSTPLGELDFATAVRQMSSVAAPYHGTRQPKMIIERPIASATEPVGAAKVGGS